MNDTSMIYVDNDLEGPHLVIMRCVGSLFASSLLTAEPGPFGKYVLHSLKLKQHFEAAPSCPVSILISIEKTLQRPLRKECLIFLPAFNHKILSHLHNPLNLLLTSPALDPRTPANQMHTNMNRSLER